MTIYYAWNEREMFTDLLSGSRKEGVYVAYV